MRKISKERTKKNVEKKIIFVATKKEKFLYKKRKFHSQQKKIMKNEKKLKKILFSSLFVFICVHKTGMKKKINMDEKFID